MSEAKWYQPPNHGNLGVQPQVGAQDDTAGNMLLHCQSTLLVLDITHEEANDPGLEPQAQLWKPVSPETDFLNRAQCKPGFCRVAHAFPMQSVCSTKPTPLSPALHSIAAHPCLGRYQFVLLQDSEDPRFLGPFQRFCRKVIWGMANHVFPLYSQFWLFWAIRDRFGANFLAARSFGAA